MTKNFHSEIEARLRCVLGELERQKEVSAYYSPSSLPFREEMEQIFEYIDLAGEYAVAYETLVATVEAHPFLLSGKAAVCLLELGLLFGYKTERKEDDLFDRR